MKFNRTSSTAFTLIELLVVIGIIAVLMVLVFSVTSVVSTKAKSTASANNMRQWGKALLLFTTDNDGIVPFEGSRDNFTWSNLGTESRGDHRAWFNVLPPYVQMLPLMELSSNPERITYTEQASIHLCPLIKWRRWELPNFSYMMNSQLYHPDSPTGGGNNPDPPIRLIHIPKPSITVMFADGDVGLSPEAGANTRARGRGRHAGGRQPGESANLIMLDGSLRNEKQTFLHSNDSVDNNHPNLIWNPWN